MRAKLWRGACAILLLALAGTPALAAPEIVWQVENPFRFFLDPTDTEVHRATWAALSPDQRKSPVLSAERELSDRHPQWGWAAGMFSKVCWDGERNRYGCPE